MIMENILSKINIGLCNIVVFFRLPRRSEPSVSSRSTTDSRPKVIFRQGCQFLILGKIAPKIKIKIVDGIFLHKFLILNFNGFGKSFMGVRSHSQSHDSTFFLLYCLLSVSIFFFTFGLKLNNIACLTMLYNTVYVCWFNNYLLQLQLQFLP